MSQVLAKKKKSPPTVPTDFIGGHFLTFRRDPTRFLTRIRELGDFAAFRIGSQPCFLVSQPEFVRDVFVTNHHKFHKGRGLQRMKRLLGEGLLTSEEEFHLSQRRLVQPAFHRQRIAGYADSMVFYAEKTANEWRDGETYDISEEMMRLTLNVVGKTLFNADVEDDAKQVGEAVDTMIGMFNVLLMPFFDLLVKLPIPHLRRFTEAQEKVDAVIYKIINERRASTEDAGDLLSILLLAQDEETGRGMSDKQVRDEVITLFLAGHETTANALTWTFYLLSQHPEIEAKLHAEIDRVAENGRQLKFEDYAELKYTEAVIAESMRLYPPAWTTARLAVEPHEIAGYEIPKGALVFMSPFTMGRDGRFWTDADKFQPERWLGENSIKEASQRFTYFPFGGGVRRCIGEQFAWMEEVLLLATLARRWRLRLVPGHPVELNPLVTLRPKYGMKMFAKQR